MKYLNFFVFLCLFTSQTFCDSDIYYWKGGNSGSWATSDNWFSYTSSSYPGHDSSDKMDKVNIGTEESLAGKVSIDLDADVTINGIAIVGESLDLSGNNALTLYGTTTECITFFPICDTLKVNVPIYLSGEMYFQVGLPFSICEFNESIEDASGGTGSIHAEGSFLFLNKANTFSGGISFESAAAYERGRLVLNGSSEMSGGSITSGPAGTGDITLKDLVVLCLVPEDNFSEITINNNIGLETDDVVYIDVSNGAKATLSGNISDGSGYTGGMHKTGNGTLILNGTNGYTGETVVKEGCLVVESSLESTSLITVKSGGSIKAATSVNVGDLVVDGGTVCGEGVYSSISLSSGGTISPGNSIGTIEVSGDYSQSSGSSYVVEINKTESDLIKIAGRATIESGAILNVSPLAVLKNGDSYDILTASDIVSDMLWDNINLSKYFELSCTNDGSNDVATLTVKRNIVCPVEAVYPGNPSNTRDYMEELDVWDNSDLKGIIERLFFVSDYELNNVLDMINLAVFSSFELVNLDSNALIASTLARQSCCFFCENDKCSERDNNLWIAPISYFNSVDQYQSLVGFDNAGGGVILGYDHCFNEDFFLGVAGGYSFSKLKWKYSRGKSDINKLFGSVYGGYFTRNLNVDFSLTGGGNFYDADRKIQFWDISRIAENHHNDCFLGSHLGVDLGKYINKESTFFGLFCTGDYSYLHQPSYKESGADSLDLKAKKKNSGLMQTELGFKITKDVKKDLCCLKGYFSFGWVRKFRLGGDEFYKARFVDFEDEDFNLEAESFSSSRNLISPEVGFSYAKKGFDFSLFYKGEYTKYPDSYLVNEFNASLRWSF